MNNPKRIDFQEAREYLGRNGFAKAIAINIFGMEATKTVHVYPQNRKNKSGASEIQIPFEAITAFILEINRYNPEPLIIDVSNCDHLKKVQSTVCNNCGQKGFYKPISFLTAQCEFCENKQEI